MKTWFLRLGDYSLTVIIGYDVNYTHIYTHAQIHAHFTVWNHAQNCYSFSTVHNRQETISIYDYLRAK